jgi:DnaJ-class molecular chaperone
VNPSEEAKAEFLKVRESFRALKNPQRRSGYDRQLNVG